MSDKELPIATSIIGNCSN